MSFFVPRPELFGWHKEQAKIAVRDMAHLREPFPIKAAPAGPPGPPIWSYTKLANNGQHLPTWFQETGDCVSMGATDAGQQLMGYQIGALRKEMKLRLWFPPYIYGTSRVQVGKGQLGREAGSTGAWAVEASGRNPFRKE